MANRTLNLTIISAKDLNKVNLFGKMGVYAVVYVDGATNQDQKKQKTPVDKEGDTNPTWNHPMKFTIDESAALHNRLTLVVKLKTEGMFGDKDLGEVHVPVKELLEGGRPLQFVTYQVRKPSGRPKGELNFSYKFGEKSGGTVEEPVMAYPAGKYNKADELDEPVMAYPAVDYGPGPFFPPLYAAPLMGAAPRPYPPPAATSAAGDNNDSYPPVSTTGGNLYPPPAVTSGGDLHTPAGGAYYPPPAGYPQPHAGYAYQQQPAYDGYYVAQPQGYGGYHSQTGYVYPPVQQPQEKKKFGLGLGAGLLGGLLIGDMVSEAAECFDF